MIRAEKGERAMYIDSLAGVIPPQAPDIRAEKKEKAEIVLPVRGADESSDARLQDEGNDVSGNRTAAHRSPQEETVPRTYYDREGKIRKNPLRDVEEGTGRELNLEV